MAEKVTALKCQRIYLPSCGRQCSPLKTYFWNVTFVGKAVGRTERARYVSLLLTQSTRANYLLSLHLDWGTRRLRDKGRQEEIRSELEQNKATESRLLLLLCYLSERCSFILIAFFYCIKEKNTTELTQMNIMLPSLLIQSSSWIIPNALTFHVIQSKL